MEDSRNIIKAIDALTLKAGGEVVDSKNITEAIDHLKSVYDQEAIGIDSTLTQEGLAADAKAVGDEIGDVKNILSGSGSGFHNSIYRGKNLGATVSSAQLSSISEGIFDDMFIGDYWTINDIVWRIAGFDYWLNIGDTNTVTHHVAIVPDTNLTSAKMNDTNTTEGSYFGSDFYTSNNSNTGRSEALSKIYSAFDSKNILSHRIILKMSSDTGYDWTDSVMDLMSEKMVYGAQICSNLDSNVPYTADKSQLPLFALEPSRICNRSYWWLRSVGSVTKFCSVTNRGGAFTSNASNIYGIRPVFAIYEG